MPCVGADWRGLASRKWTVSLSTDFGVNGDDNSVRARVRADWQAIPHLSIRMGYQLLDLSLDADAALGGVSRRWSTNQTMHGPEVGIGIVF